MAYDIYLADRVRAYLAEVPGLRIDEKRMFGGLAFLVNEKMCVNISGDRLMCRYHPELEEEVAERKGHQPMVMRGKLLKGYCYVTEDGFAAKKDFDYWLKLCLDYNNKAARAGKEPKKA